MSEMENTSQTWPSVRAIMLGFVAVVVLSVVTDAAMYKAGIFPKLGTGMSNGLFALATVYRTVYGILGSYVTARFAPYKPMKHSLIGSVIGLVLSIGGAVATWNKTEMGPHWYPLALVVTALPTAWLGAKIKMMSDK